MKFFEQENNRRNGNIKFDNVFKGNEQSCLDTGLFTQKQIDKLKELNYLDVVIKNVTEPPMIGMDEWDLYEFFKDKNIVSENDEYQSMLLFINTKYEHENVMEEIETIINKYKEKFDEVLFNAFDFEGPEKILVFLFDKNKENNNDKKIEEIKLGRYKHFKGNEYQVLYIAKNSETLEDMVVYKALYGAGGIWVRPLSMWFDNVVKDGKEYKRFEYIGE